MAVPEALRGQHVADDDDGRAPDTRSVHLRRDVAERAAKDHLTGLARICHDGDGAVESVVRLEIGDDLVDALHSKVQDECRLGRAE